MKTIRVGLAGAGAIAPGQCQGVNSHPQGQVAAVADSNAGRAAELQAAYGIDRVYRNVKDLVRDPDLDAIAIALPTHLHAPVALAALEAGKHVLLDKPFAMNRAEAEQVVAAARRRRRVVMVGMNQRYTPEAQTIKTVVDRGELGEVYHAKAYWLRRAGCPRFGTWFCDKKRSGGGGLLDIGVHMLDLALHLLANFKPVTASGVTYTMFGNRGLGEGGWGKSDRGAPVFNVDDLAAAFIRLQGGATLLLEVSWARHQAEANKHNVELFGTEAGASVFPARICRAAQTAGEYEVVEPQDVALPRPRCERMADWLDAILGLAKPLCTPAEALAVQILIDAIYESARTGREVRIGR